MNDERIKEILEKLLKIYSPTDNEKDLAKYLIEFLRKLGAEIYLDEGYKNYGGNSPTIFAKLKGTVKGEGVTLSAHMDVVEPNKDLKFFWDGNILKTDGNTTLGGDDKGGIASILYSIEEIINNNVPHKDIYVVFTPGEEKGMKGARNIDWDKVYKNMNPAKNMIVLDNAGKAKYVAHSAPGCYNFSITLNGKKAHAGIEPEKGINAIVLMSEIISKFKFGRINDETTANISEINSEFPSNVVPDICIAKGEMRSHDLNVLDKMIEDLNKISEEVTKRYNASYKLDYTCEYPVLKPLDNLEFAKEFVNVYKSIGVDAKLQVIGGGSDSNFFAKEGFNSIIIGVGMEKVHTTEEYLDLEELKKSTKALIKYLSIEN